MINLKTINLRKSLSILGLGLAVFAVGSAAQPASAASLTLIRPAQINQTRVADHFFIVYGNGGDGDRWRDADHDRRQDARQDRREDHRNWREARRDRREDFRDAHRDWHQDQHDGDQRQAWHQDQHDGNRDGGGWNHDH